MKRFAYGLSYIHTNIKIAAFTKYKIFLFIFFVYVLIKLIDN